MYTYVNIMYCSVVIIDITVHMAYSESSTASGSMGANVNDTVWRGSKEVWLASAYDALIEAGVDAVRIQSLAKKLKLSRTSFYWFFTDRNELLTPLPTSWADKNNQSNKIGKEAWRARTEQKGKNSVVGGS